MKTCTKQFPSIPFAHRAPFHDGHCRLIHGHNWIFEFEFASESLDPNGFVFDFGKLKPLKDKLNEFDHALVLNSGDPLLAELQERLAGLANIVAVPDCSAEGLAEAGWTYAATIVGELSKGRVRVVRCTVFEDEKNSATFAPSTK